MKNAIVIVAVVVLVAGVAFYKSTRTTSSPVTPDPSKVVLTQSVQTAAEPAKPAVADRTQPPEPTEAPSAPGAICPEPPPLTAAAPADTQPAESAEQSAPVAAAAQAEPPTATTAEPVPAVASAPSTPADAKLPRVVDLGADKCKACKDLAPILAELKQEYAGRVTVEFIDVWKNRSAGEPYKIRIIPTQVFFDRDGKEVWRHEGFLPKADFIAKFAELGVK